ncbi:hypothetical protein AM500_21420 [Bacillus sp. FJAT-18017]|nr:hypothetical protein AM500_21420 [Bacillus sp. FJAT-18017]
MDLANPSDSDVAWLSGGNRSYAGKVVNETTALSYIAVFSCVNVISETMASLPLHLYRDKGSNGRAKAREKKLYDLLHSRPNEEMTSFTFRQVLQACILLWGNGYAFIDWGPDGEPRGLYPQHPSKVIPKRNPTTKKMGYEVAGPDGKVINLSADQMLHLVGFSLDGLVGLSVIGLARESIGLGQAAEEYGSRFFSNGAKPLGVLEHPGELGEDAIKHLRSSWDEMHKGLENSHKVAILEEGMTYKQIGIPPEDAQFLQTRKFQLEEIARLYRVPLHLVGNLDKATFSNIEHQDIGFAKHTIRPWAVRWEQTLNWKLLTTEERKQYYAEYNLDGLMRGDMKSRYEAYQIGRQNGWLSGNDIRDKENEDKIEGLDAYLVNGNMIPVNMAGQQYLKGGEKSE